jgi:hypothetical protein
MPVRAHERVAILHVLWTGSRGAFAGPSCPMTIEAIGSVERPARRGASARSPLRVAAAIVGVGIDVLFHALGFWRHVLLSDLCAPP